MAAIPRSSSSPDLITPSAALNAQSTTVSSQPPNMGGIMAPLRRRSRSGMHNPARSGLRISTRAATRTSNRLHLNHRLRLADTIDSHPNSSHQSFSALRRLFRLRRRAQSVLVRSDKSEDFSDTSASPFTKQIDRTFKAGTYDAEFSGRSPGQGSSGVQTSGTLDYASSEAVEEHHRAFARRRHKLKCLEFDEYGNSVERYLSRQDILNEAVAASNPAQLRPANAAKRSVIRYPKKDVAASRLQDLRLNERRTRNLRNKTLGKAAAQVNGSKTSVVSNNSRLASRNDLTLRDIRQVDPAFTAKAALWVRQNALVVSLEAVRAVILHNKLLLFDPDNERVRKPIKYIQQRLTVGVRNAEEAFMPFEFRALEGILINSCINLEREFSGIEPVLMTTLGHLPTQINAEHLEQLRFQEQRLNHFYARSRKLQHVLQSVLDEDEDMASMYLTEKHRAPEVTRNPVDHDEAEMLLETYLQVVDDLTNKAGLLNRAIDDTENLIEIHLDTMQNQLLLVNLLITAVSTVLTFATAVTAIFGMNLPFPDAMANMPSSQYYFWGLVGGLGLVMTSSVIILIRWSQRQGLYSGRHGLRRRNEVAPNKGISPAAFAKEMANRIKE